MLRRVWYIFLWVACVTGIVSVCVIVTVQISGSKQILASLDEIKDPASVAIILGASVKRDGSPSDALRDRLETGIDLYRQQKVRALLLTGDNGQMNSDEIDAMLKIAEGQGIPAEAVLVDPHGYRTYESCHNAATVFHITDAIIVTQRFHLPRAIYLCEHAGIRSRGWAADKHTYQQIIFFTVRDWFASALAWWDVHIWTPRSVVSPL